MHVRLRGPPASDFAPEPFTPLTVRGACHSPALMAAGVREALTFRCLETESHALEDAAAVVDRLDRVETILSRLLELEGCGLGIRVHGDFHLGQVLHTGDDLVFIDFEGDSSRPMLERLIKTSPLVDVASMLRVLEGSSIVPSNRAEFDLLLGVYIVGKSIYQLGYELSHRPEWLRSH
jgi:maltose alpha-D-glucosyltransferase / alpha-amylase